MKLLRIGVAAALIPLLCFSTLLAGEKAAGEKGEKTSSSKKDGTKAAEPNDTESDSDQQGGEDSKNTVLDLFLDSVVYVSGKSKIYHSEGCKLLDAKGAPEATAVKLSELKEKGGYRPCRKCDPPDYKD